MNAGALRRYMCAGTRSFKNGLLIIERFVATCERTVATCIHLSLYIEMVAMILTCGHVPGSNLIDYLGARAKLFFFSTCEHEDELAKGPDAAGDGEGGDEVIDQRINKIRASRISRSVFKRPIDISFFAGHAVGAINQPWP